MVDVLIITALELEYQQARAAGTATAPGRTGVARWKARNTPDMTPYLLGEFAGPDDVRLSVALARSVHMGGRETSPVTSILVSALQPRCLAMTGVCAGNPARVALGDVVVATQVFAYEEGRQTATGFQGRHRPLPIDDRLVRAA
jgi:nucleoside phosphorylase